MTPDEEHHSAYYDAAVQASHDTKAETLIMVVLNGHSGDQVTFVGEDTMARSIPTTLREIADRLEIALTHTGVYKRDLD